MSINPDWFPLIPAVTDDSSRPFWSVLVPAYKPQFLVQAITSVLVQDPGPGAMEIIVLDDGSPHALEPLVVQAGGSRVRYIRRDKNRGTYPTINELLRLSRGVWTHILNDDDWVLAGFYSTLRRGLENQPREIGAAFCRCTNVDVQGNPLWSPPSVRPASGVLENWLEMIAVMNPTHPVAVVVRRETHERLGGYREDLKYVGDWDFYIRSAAFSRWWYECQPLACYRQHAQNFSNQGMASAEQIVEIGRVIEYAATLLPADKRAQIAAHAREYQALFAIREAENSLVSGDSFAAIRQLQAGLKLSASKKVVDKLAVLFTHPNALTIRQYLPQFILSFQLPT